MLANGPGRHTSINGHVLQKVRDLDTVQQRAAGSERGAVCGELRAAVHGLEYADAEAFGEDEGLGLDA